MIGMTGKQLCSSFNNFAERSIFLLKLLFPKVKKEMELSRWSNKEVICLREKRVESGAIPNVFDVIDR